MRLFNRISTTVLSSVDSVISKVENHEAMVDAMITDIQKNAGKARVQLKRVQKDRQASEKQIAELKQNAELWQKRALDSANEDEDRALQCLQRRKQCQQRLETLNQSLHEQTSQEQNLLAKQKKIEERLQEVKQQRNLMRSRESVSGAMRVLKSIEGDGCGQLDDAFDRWEVSMATAEIEGGDLYSDDLENADSLAQAYRSDEQQQQLRAELAELKHVGNQTIDSQAIDSQTPAKPTDNKEGDPDV